MKDNKEVQQILQDATTAREERCKPIVAHILQYMLDKDFVLADLDYVDQMVQFHIEQGFRDVVIIHKAEIMEWVRQSLQRGLDEAHIAVYGKRKEEMTAQDVENALKNKKVPEDK